MESTPNLKVGFAGDWHGNLPWAIEALQAFHEAEVSRIYHVGDFGIWPGRFGSDYLSFLHDIAEQLEQNLYVTLGNHEDYDQVASMTETEEGWLQLPNLPRFNFAPRGHVWLDGKTRMGSLGGAGSIDRALRTAGQDWWPEEEITEANCATLASNVTNAGWDRLDVLVTHEAPAGLRRVGMQPRPAWITPDIEHDCYLQRVRLRNVVDVVQPRTLVHGHWHEWITDSIDGTNPAGDSYTTSVFALAKDNMANNCIVGVLRPGYGIDDIEVLHF
jgi:Icc-related predicted phosphoesterase